MVAKAEYLAKGANPRFVVTSISAGKFDARTLYEQDYCARGEMENRIKEQQLYLFADRVSAGSMRANQLRLYQAAAAYLLIHALRRLGLEGHAAGAGPGPDHPPEAAQDRHADPGDHAAGVAVLVAGLAVPGAVREGL